MQSQFVRSTASVFAAFVLFCGPPRRTAMTTSGGGRRRSSTTTFVFLQPLALTLAILITLLTLMSSTRATPISVAASDASANRRLQMSVQRLHLRTDETENNPNKNNNTNNKNKDEDNHADESEIVFSSGGRDRVQSVHELERMGRALPHSVREEELVYAAAAASSSSSTTTTSGSGNECKVSKVVGDDQISLHAHLSPTVVRATAIEQFKFYYSTKKRHAAAGGSPASGNAHRLESYSILFQIKEILKYENELMGSGGNKRSNQTNSSSSSSNKNNNFVYLSSQDEAHSSKVNLNSFLLIENLVQPSTTSANAALPPSSSNTSNNNNSSSSSNSCRSVDVRLNHNYYLFLDTQAYGSVAERKYVTHPIRLNSLSSSSSSSSSNTMTAVRVQKRLPHLRHRQNRGRNRHYEASQAISSSTTTTTTATPAATSVKHQVHRAAAPPLIVFVRVPILKLTARPVAQDAPHVERRVSRTLCATCEKAIKVRVSEQEAAAVADDESSAPAVSNSTRRRFLECHYQGNPRPRIVWLRNGAPLLRNNAAATSQHDYSIVSNDKNLSVLGIIDKPLRGGANEHAAVDEFTCSAHSFRRIDAPSLFEPTTLTASIRLTVAHQSAIQKSQSLWSNMTKKHSSLKFNSSLPLFIAQSSTATAIFTIAKKSITAGGTDKKVAGAKATPPFFHRPPASPTPIAAKASTSSATAVAAGIRTTSTTTSKSKAKSPSRNHSHNHGHRLSNTTRSTLARSATTSTTSQTTTATAKASQTTSHLLATLRTSRAHVVVRTTRAVLVKPIARGGSNVTARATRSTSTTGSRSKTASSTRKPSTSTTATKAATTKATAKATTRTTTKMTTPPTTTKTTTTTEKTTTTTTAAAAAAVATTTTSISSTTRRRALLQRRQYVRCAPHDNTCENGGVCYASNPHFYRSVEAYNLMKIKFCICPEFYEGPNCEIELMRSIDYDVDEIPVELRSLWNNLAADSTTTSITSTTTTATVGDEDDDNGDVDTSNRPTNAAEIRQQQMDRSPPPLVNQRHFAIAAARPVKISRLSKA